MVTANRRTLIHIVAAAAFAAALPTLLMAVDFLGHRIPQADKELPARAARGVGGSR